MRAFVIADASKRKAKPVAVLLWDADADGGRGAFSLEVSSQCREADLPLSFSFCAQRDGGRATPRESEEWVRSRIVPEDRHNIVEVLRANGLAEYDAVSLLAACQGRSSDDDFLCYEVAVPEDIACQLSGADSGRDVGESSDEVGTRSMTRADKLLAAVERRRSGPNVSYAIVSLRDADGCSSPNDADANGPRRARNERGRCDGGEANAAACIGAQIRKRRREAGLTQKQLAARAGIAQAVLSRVESGSGNPTLALIEDLSFALGCKLSIELV